MKRQYKANYLNKNVFDEITTLRKDDAYKYKIIGLLESISTFDTISNFENPTCIPSLLAVANNLITRGNPTICNKEISTKLDFLSNGLSAKDFYNALHLVDARPNISELFYEDLESKFEKAFIHHDITEDKRYLTQFFQHQREKKTLTNDGGDAGRVDFSFEDPYFKKVRKTTIYQKEKELKERTVFIIEVDGKLYHNKLIDDIRDYETAKFGHTTKRITEDNTSRDTANLIETLSKTDYFKRIESLLQKDFEEIKKLQTYVLAPVAIARLQKVINQFLIVKYEELKANNKSNIRVAIIERDVPCGQLAVDDLNELYHNLVELEYDENNEQKKQKGITFIPKIETTIYADRNFFNQVLQPADCKFNNDNVVANEYDLVIDIATLWRTGIFKADADFQNIPNSVIIRSSHFTEKNCCNEIYCSDKVEYRDLTIEIGNEQHKEINEALPYIEYFLINLFQKEKFLKGQLPILNRALKNKTVIGLLPTGGGKSLTYQLAALLQPGITIIVDPIRSLMVDQYEGLLNIGIDKCDFINSILSREEKKFIQDEVLPAGKTQFLFCSPERLVIQEFRDALEKTNKKGFYFSYCVIDEAHCVSEWGHDFRTPYLNLGENATKRCLAKDSKIEIKDGIEKVINPVPIFGLTATASFDVLADIERELKITRNDGNAVIRYENTVRDEINYLVYPITVDKPVGIQPTKEEVGNGKLLRAQNVITGINRQDKLIHIFNNKEKYSKILAKTFEDYLPVAEKETLIAQHRNELLSDKEEEAKREFIKTKTGKIILSENDDLPFHKNDKNKYNYGIIVFCPHKTGELGVKTYIEKLQSPNDKIVFFKGSSDSLDQDQQDNLSFENLKLFKEDEASVMVATKAFGMGIDKPNIRLTIHANIPSSIESFVQESGRAGRDGKTSLSIILYNNQIGRDRNVLEWFWKNSFKGADKERSVIWELRNKIFFPNITNLISIREKINEEFEEEYKIDLGRITRAGVNWTHKIYVEVIEGSKVGSIDIVAKTTSVAVGYGNSERAELILKKIVSLIPNFSNLTKNDTRNFLKQSVTGIEPKEGLEQLLKNDDYDFSKPIYIYIPFKNKYFSKNENGGNENTAFEEHFNYFMQQWPLHNNRITGNNLREIFKNAIKEDHTFNDFINELPLNNDEKEILLTNTILKRSYYIPRNQDDTAKAIYRLTSIGIIDTYTIEFSKKVYKVKLSKKTDKQYFDNYQRLVERYTSQQEAGKLRTVLENDYEINKNNEDSTVISKCLDHLTDFIYEKIADKRWRAINDMVGLCDETIIVTDTIRQSEIIKENIYYYFNAKYAREGNKSGDKNADLTKEINRDDIENVIWDYLNFIEIDDNGAFITNIKHLRGATMRMLRTYALPQFNFLKSYTLFILASTPNGIIDELRDQAQTEFKLGVESWTELSPDTFNFESILDGFNNKLKSHLTNIPDDYFGDIDDYYYSAKYSNWLKEFNPKFLKDYSDAITTSN